ncbi:MAG TPA: DUF507 family protein [Thermodesulfovibrionales bacterium]|jgi:hypothetical protein|nr:DUF507 family protein [Thermodesulfovibrionales bacterium]
MLSEDKISHVSHVLLKGLLDGGMVRIRDDEGKVRKEIKRCVVSFLRVSEDIDETVRKKMQSFSRKIIEGSPEWEVLYKKFYKEEAAKRGMASE